MEYLIPTPSQLGQAFKSRRSECNLTQAEAASKVGLLPKTVSGLEGHPEVASVESFFKLIVALDLELILRPKGEAAHDEQRESW